MVNVNKKHFLVWNRTDMLEYLKMNLIKYIMKKTTMTIVTILIIIVILAQSNIYFDKYNGTRRLCSYPSQTTENTEKKNIR